MSNFKRLISAVWQGGTSLLFLAALPAVQGALLPVTNFSFENPDAPNGTFLGSSTSAPFGWTVYNTGPSNGNRAFGVWDPTGTLSYNQPLPNGTQVGVVFLDDVLGQEAGLLQTLSTNLALSSQYTLTVSVGNFRPGVGEPWDFTGFPGYRVDLMAGGIVLASDNNNLSPAEGQFLTSTVSFTTGLSHAQAGQALGIRLVNLNGSGVEVNFDNVSLDVVAVPEPGSYAFLALGLGILCLLHHRRIRRS